jgi:hypothetical protein
MLGCRTYVERVTHVQLRRHHVGALVETQSRRVAEHALRFALPVSRPELPDHQVRARRQRELTRPAIRNRFSSRVYS